MIIAVGSDKGSPGATTLAAVLGLVWPGTAVVTELDPRGADLPFRLLCSDGAPMRPAPSVASLAVDARAGSMPPPFERYAQQTMLGVPVIPGEPSARANERMVKLLPALCSAAAQWKGTLIADLGVLHKSNPAVGAAKAAAAVLLVVRPSVEGLAHLRDRVDELGAQVSDPQQSRTSVGVVVASEARRAHAAAARVRELLASVGSPAPLVGVFVHDAAAAALLYSNAPVKKLPRNPLVRSGQEIVTRVLELWPELYQVVLPGQPTAPAATDTRRPPPSRPQWVDTLPGGYPPAPPSNQPSSQPVAPPPSWARPVQRPSGEVPR